MSRTPEQNLDGVMRYLRHMEPKREQFEQVTRYDIAALQARMDCMEAHIAQLEARIDELVPDPSTCPADAGAPGAFPSRR